MGAGSRGMRLWGGVCGDGSVWGTVTPHEALRRHSVLGLCVVVCFRLMDALVCVTDHVSPPCMGC